MYNATWVQLEVYDIDPIDSIHLVASYEMDQADTIDVEGGVALLRMQYTGEIVLLSLY